VLGGLMQDTVTESEDRVPVLGAIPLLGNLFKSRSGSRQKSNLLVFLRPKILRDQPATEAVSAAKYDEIRQQERDLHKGKIWLLPGEKQPSIPQISPNRGPTTIAPAAQPAARAQPAPPSEQPAPAAQPAPGAQPAPVAQPAQPSALPAPAAQPAPAPQPAVGPRPLATP
jgi:general secretion pathway protein D